tara:strand:- start:2519 stop:3970 length:1452 start_codon:yes stop_codon:yes gene_type:complete
MSPLNAKSDPRQICIALNERTPKGGLFEGDREHIHPQSNLPWRISPEPFWLNQEQINELKELGKSLHQFYKAANTLYHQSAKGLQPSWITEYLDLGKPSHITEMGLWNRIKSQLPLVMRPDLLLTEEGFRIIEMDSVPGGMGFTAQISHLYSDLGYDLIGGRNGLIEGFYNALSASTNTPKPTIAFVVSDESESYRAEMQWIANQFNQSHSQAYCIHPRDIHFDNAGLFIKDQGLKNRIDAIYRFFELFDLKNIPKAELISYFTKKNNVRLTPPPKAYLEEKLWLALFHHPCLTSFWKKELRQTAFDQLSTLIPQTWILDPRPIPPHASVSNLEINNLPINSWDQLKGLSKKQRELVIKPSGFSELAYESKGVSVGHDMSEETWNRKIQIGLDQFKQTPYILQKFHKSIRKTMHYYDFYDDKLKPMRGRTLIRPYFYLIDGTPNLSGVQAVVCPPDKKILHGMVDAIITPCALQPENLQEKGF